MSSFTVYCGRSRVFQETTFIQNFKRKHKIFSVFRSHANYKILKTASRKLQMQTFLLLFNCRTDIFNSLKYQFRFSEFVINKLNTLFLWKVSIEITEMVVLPKSVQQKIYQCFISYCIRSLPPKKIINYYRYFLNMCSSILRGTN